MPWHDELGFEENPLDIRPNTNLVGLEQQERQLKNHIRKGELCFLNGMTGSGKTSLLKKVQEEMTDHTFMYLDAQDLPDDFNIEDELTEQRSFLDRIALREYPSDEPVLIIDEFQDTNQDIILEARAKWESKEKIQSIVIAQIDQQLDNVTDSLKERIGKRTITLPNLTDTEMEAILEQRLGEYYKKLHSEALNL
ncbi:MAG: AAA family ATPase, partial [Halobacteriaceae archaeon]